MESFMKIALFVVWGVIGLLVSINYWKKIGGFHFGWWQELLLDNLHSPFMVQLKVCAMCLITLLPFGIFEAVLLTFKAMLFVASIIGGSGVSSRPRRNTDSLGRNYTDPYNQGRIDAANGAAPLNPGDQNYMNGYNNGNKY